MPATRPITRWPSDLLRILEMMLTRRAFSPDTNRRRNIESLVAAHERLWMLSHPEIPPPS